MSNSNENNKRVPFDGIIKTEYLAIQAFCLKKMSKGISDYNTSRFLKQEALEVRKKEDELVVSKNINLVLDHIIHVMINNPDKDSIEKPCRKHNELYSLIVRESKINFDNFTLSDAIFAVQKYIQVELKGLFPKPVIVCLIKILNNLNYVKFSDLVPYTLNWRCRMIFQKILYIFREISEQNTLDNFVSYHYASILFRSSFPKTSIINSEDHSRVFHIVEFLYQLDYDTIPENFSFYGKNLDVPVSVRKRLEFLKIRGLFK